jgi:hypothetical protein
MKSKKKNNKVPKSAKTRLSDLTPKQDARGGGYIAPTPPVNNPPRATSYKRRAATL